MDVDAYTDQLDGLVNLLHAVGIDTVDNSELRRASVSLKKQGSGAAVVFSEEIGEEEARQLNDDQIEAMIVKLQQAQAQAPQLMAALQEHVVEQNGGRKLKKKGFRDAQATSERAEFMQAYQQQTKKQLGYHHQRHQPHQNHHRQSKQQPHKHPQQPKKGHHQQQQPHEQNPQPYQQQQADHDDYDEEEDEDEFDEDADYPMVGHGISDDISVVSDMTTPTVVSSVNVADEERYEEMKMPMIVGGGANGPPMVIQPPKRKNLVGGGRVGRNKPAMIEGRAAITATAAPPRVGGAAAQRRKNYQETMARLHQNPYGMTMVGPTALMPPAADIEPFTPQFPDGDQEEVVGSSATEGTRTKKIPSRSKSGGKIEKGEARRTGKTPTRTKSAGNKSSAASTDLLSDSYHSGTDLSFATTPSDWMPFGEVTSGDTGSVGGSQSVKSSGTRKKGMKTKSSKGTKSSSSKNANTTTIDKDGFLFDASDPFGLKPAPAKTLKNGDYVSGGDSVDSSQSENNGKPRNKVVKKKVVKKSDRSMSASVGERPSSSAKLRKSSSTRADHIQPASSGGIRPSRRAATSNH